MIRAQKQRLKFLIYCALSMTLGAGLLFYALQQNMMYFYTPYTLKMSASSSLGKKIRLGGEVQFSSFKQDSKTLQTVFWIGDKGHLIEVQYKGVLPDLFREGQWIIAEGKLISASVLKADQVLAKHDEIYRPADVAAEKKQGKLGAEDCPSNFTLQSKISEKEDSLLASKIKKISFRSTKLAQQYTDVSLEEDYYCALCGGINYEGGNYCIKQKIEDSIKTESHVYSARPVLYFSLAQFIKTYLFILISDKYYG